MVIGNISMINPPFAPNDKYFGRKEICLFSESTVQALFPLDGSSSSSCSSSSSSSSSPSRSRPSHTRNRSISSPFKKGKRSKKDSRVEEMNSDSTLEISMEDEEEGENTPVKPPLDMSEWLAYVFYRTALPLPIIFHALHLLRRLSVRYSFDPHSPSSKSPLVHHRLIFTSLILATTYSMDDAYSLKSWAVASKGVFSLEELTDMQLEMFESLSFTLADPQEESFFGDRVRIGLVDIIEGYLEDWEMRLQEERVRIQKPVILESESGLCSSVKKKKVGGYLKKITSGEFLISGIGR